MLSCAGVQVSFFPLFFFFPFSLFFLFLSRTSLSIFHNTKVDVMKSRMMGELLFVLFPVCRKGKEEGAREERRRRKRFSSLPLLSLPPRPPFFFPFCFYFLRTKTETQKHKRARSKGDGRRQRSCFQSSHCCRRSRFFRSNFSFDFAFWSPLCTPCARERTIILPRVFSCPADCDLLF